jgi:hypothetical protein
MEIDGKRYLRFLVRRSLGRPPPVITSRRCRFTWSRLPFDVAPCHSRRVLVRFMADYCWHRLRIVNKYFVYREELVPHFLPTQHNTPRQHIRSSTNYPNTTNVPMFPQHPQNQPFGLTSTPSYSLASIYCSVLSKCFRGLSSPLTFSVVLRLLWISSIRPLMYLVVTASFSWSK